MARRTHAADDRPGRLARAVRAVLLPGLLVVAAYYALFGGEYSAFELRSARGTVVQTDASLERLHAEIDSLRAWADSLRHDAGTIERIAREEFGMIREGETLYRFVDAGDETVPAPAPEKR